MAEWIPYGRQSVRQEDIESVVRTLKSEWLTTGPAVDAFEQAIADYTGAKYAVAFNSGTSALHAAYFAAGVGPGDEVITTPISFVATANAALMLGARPVFADVEPEGITLDPRSLPPLISERTRVIAPVDFGGHPAELDEIMSIAEDTGAVVVEDACHALGAQYKGRPVGSIAHMTVFSFHPVKAITTGEGGAVCTNDPAYYERLRMFRNHGITKSREAMERWDGPWYYEMRLLGYNYRLSDIHAALGLAQLRRVDEHIERRSAIARRYDQTLGSLELLLPRVKPHVKHAWHLYPVQLSGAPARRRFVDAMHAAGVGVQVHYIPIYKHPYYRELGYDRHSCPNAELYYSRAVSLPLFPDLTDAEFARVVGAVRAAIGGAPR